MNNCDTFQKYRVYCIHFAYLLFCHVFNKILFNSDSINVKYTSFIIEHVVVDEYRGLTVQWHRFEARRARQVNVAMQ